MNGNDFLSGFLENSANFVQYIANIGNEVGLTEGVFLSIIVPSIGFLISASAVYDIIRMKDPRYAQKVMPGNVAARLIVGPITILLQPFMLQISESVFGNDVTDGRVPTAMTYSALIANKTDPTEVMLLGICSFLVFVGWVTALRAMLAFARCGNPQQDGYQLAKSGLARLIAATFLTMIQFVLDDLFESVTGAADTFSSQLNL